MFIAVGFVNCRTESFQTVRDELDLNFKIQVLICSNGADKLGKGLKQIYVDLRDLMT